MFQPKEFIEFFGNCTFSYSDWVGSKHYASARGLDRHKNGTRSSSRVRVFLIENLFGKLKVDGDLSLNFYRLAVQQIRLILPLLDRVRGGFGQLRIAAQHLHLSDVTCF